MINITLLFDFISHLSIIFFISAFSSIADNQWSKSMKKTCRIQRKSRRLRSDRTAVRSIGPGYRSSPTRFGHRFARCAVNAATYPVDRVKRNRSRIEELVKKSRKGRRVGSAECSQTFSVLWFPIEISCRKGESFGKVLDETIAPLWIISWCHRDLSRR